MQRKRMRQVRTQALGLACTLLASACSPDEPTFAPPRETLAPSERASVPAPPEALRPTAYVSKVKNLLTGLPPTDAEVAAVTRDPRALSELIEGWMALPEHRAKMLDFFRNAFQQNRVSLAALQESLGIPGMLQASDAEPNNVAAQLERSLMDSFALTVWELLANGRPLSEALVTDRYMLNPPLMSLLSLLDELTINDYGWGSNRFLDRTAGFTFTIDLRNPNIPLEQTLDPASANYLRWSHPLAPSTGCTQPAWVYNQAQHNYGSQDNAVNLFNFLLGKLASGCYYGRVDRFRSHWTELDFNDWRMVKIDRAGAGRDTSPLFYDLRALRSAQQMTLRVPRVGFFGTLAFHANWPTNTTNLHRVTANQTLIVALGKSFDGSGTTVPLTDSTLDRDHATPGSDCYGCHQSLDPFRQFFRQSYSLYYHEQTDAQQLKQPASFGFDGVQSDGQGIGDLAAILAAHPRFAVAWTQKLCQWANSLPCAEDDPEFLRVASVWKRSGYKWKTLVHELFASPLVTLARNTRTYDTQGVTLSIARRDHLCVALSNRLGIADVCGLLAQTKTPAQAELQRYAAFLPVDGYDRGLEIPSLPTAPSVFFRVGTESLCLRLADLAVDGGGSSRYSSARPDEALTDFVGTLMAIVPSDPRAAALRQILQEHQAAALAAGASASEALKSTFTLACASPSSVLVGL